MITAAKGAWRTVRLGDVGQSLIGLTYNPSSVKRSGTLVLRSSNIQNGKLSFEDNVYVDTPIPDRIRIRGNDILICVRNGSRRLIGKSILLDGRVVGQTFGAFMAVYRSDANQFLQYFFQSDEFKRQIDEHLGATINQITNGSLNGFVVALPGRAERDEIASRLMDVDRLISALHRLIAKKQSIKQGMTQQLLTGRTRLPGFAESWEHQRLGNVLGFQAGYPFRSAQFSKSALGPRLVRNRDLKSDDSVIFYLGEYHANYILRDGDVLVGMDGDFTPCTWRGGDALLNQRIGRLLCKHSDPIFMYYALQGPLKVLEGGTGATTVKHLSHGDVEAIEMTLPNIDEQRAIGSVLADADADLCVVFRRLEKARATKRGMMQELLTGRTRLPVAEAAL